MSNTITQGILELDEQARLTPALPADDALRMQQEEVRRDLFGRLVSKHAGEASPKRGVNRPGRSHRGKQLISRPVLECVMQALSALGGYQYIVACAISSDPEARAFAWRLFERCMPSGHMLAVADSRPEDSKQLSFSMQLAPGPEIEAAVIERFLSVQNSLDAQRG